MYHQTPNIRCTYFQNVNVSCLILQLSLLNPLKPGGKLRMEMANYIWVINNFIAY